MFEEAIAAHKEMGAVSPEWKWPLVRTYALAGRQDDARKMLAEFLAGEPKPTGAWDGLFLPEVYAALDEKDEAFRLLKN